jgi:hypothetical protein
MRSAADHSETSMRGLIGWLAAFIVGSIGWWLGRKVGLGAAVVLGSVGTGVGLYVGYRWFDNNLR